MGNKEFLDDCAKVLGGLFSITKNAASGLVANGDAKIRRALNPDQEVVQEEIEVLRDLVSRLTIECEKLRARIEVLEDRADWK